MFGAIRRRGSRTRAWVTISVRRVDPSGTLEHAAQVHGLRVLESIAFDGASAAVCLHLRSLGRRHEPRSRIELGAADRARLRACLADVHADPTVEDVIFETHLGGTEDVVDVAVLPFDSLLDRIDSDQLRAGVRYVSD